jgi:hypothetical protein
MKTRLLLPAILLAASLAYCGIHASAASPSKPVSAKKFDALADAALAAMKKRAAELKVSGVAVVSYAEGDSVQGWTSKISKRLRKRATTSSASPTPSPPRWLTP